MGRLVFGLGGLFVGCSFSEFLAGYRWCGDWLQLVGRLGRGISLLARCFGFYSFILLEWVALFLV